MASLASLSHDDGSLDSLVWAKLPRDIIYNIIDRSDLLTQVSWSNTGLKFAPYTRAKMWKGCRTNNPSDGTVAESVTALLSTWGALRKMRSLSIGHLVFAEAKGLAQLVMNLELKSLQLDCGNVGKGPGEIEDGTSPLIPFLEALRGQTTCISGGQPDPGLPETLENLCLTDHGHTKIPFLHGVLANALIPFTALAKVTIAFRLTEDADEKFERMELPRMDENTAHDMIAIDSWSLLSCPKPKKVLLHYMGLPGQESYRVQTITGLHSGRWLEVKNLSKTMDKIIAERIDGVPTSRTMEFVRLPDIPDNAIVIYPCENIGHRAHAQLEPVRIPC